MKTFNPIVLFAVWIIGIIVVDIIELATNSYDGLFFAYFSIPVGAAGILLLCLLCSIFNIAWFKKNWYVIVPVSVFAALFLFWR